MQAEIEKLKTEAKLFQVCGVPNLDKSGRIKFVRLVLTTRT